MYVSSPRWIFIVFPACFVVSPVEDLLLHFTQEKFENLMFFLVSRAVPTGVLRQVCFLKHRFDISVAVPLNLV